jgi:hypothetical protein
LALYLKQIGKKFEMKDKTHYKSAFKNSKYLSSADLDSQITLTIKCVKSEPDKSNRSKAMFNTAYFVEKEIRPGDELKPMVLNMMNSKTMKIITGSAYIDDWNDIAVSIYVDNKVKFGSEFVEGLRISPERPKPKEKEVLTQDYKFWHAAVARYKETGNFDAIEAKMIVSDDIKFIIETEAANVS